VLMRRALHCLQRAQEQGGNRVIISGNGGN
jgi:hypothetical protein